MALRGAGELPSRTHRSSIHYLDHPTRHHASGCHHLRLVAPDAVRRVGVHCIGARKSILDFVRVALDKLQTVGRVQNGHTRLFTSQPLRSRNCKDLVNIGVSI